LGKELTDVKLEMNILKKAFSILFGKTHNKFEFIREQRDPLQYTRRQQERLLLFGMTGSHREELLNLVLIEQINIIHYLNKDRYGSPMKAREK
jgi:hypothetical protein